MKNLEILYKAKEEFEKVTKEIKENQAKIKDVVTEKRNDGWLKMFEDLYNYEKYSKYIDTGINAHNNADSTLGFRIDKDCIVVYSCRHVNNHGKRIEPDYDYCHYPITKEKPFETKERSYDYMIERIVYAIENWESVKIEIEKRIVLAMELQMKKDNLKLEENQKKLERELKGITKI